MPKYASANDAWKRNLVLERKRDAARAERDSARAYLAESARKLRDMRDAAIRAAAALVCLTAPDDRPEDWIRREAVVEIARRRINAEVPLLAREVA